MKRYIPSNSTGQNSENLQENKSQNFWEFIDSKVQSQSELENFCKRNGLELAKRIATGGFGSVYLAQDVLDGNRVAVKLLDFAPHQPNILTRFWNKDANSYCEVYVEYTQTLQEILSKRPILLDLEDIIPFIIGYENHDDRNIPDAPSTQLLEYVKYPQLVEYCCHDDFQYQMSRVSEKFLPGILELWLFQILDETKLKNLQLFDLWNLAPALSRDYAWQKIGNGCFEFVSGSYLLFPENIIFSLKDFIEQSHQLFADHGRNIIGELLLGSTKENQWKFAWIPEDWDTLSEHFLSQFISIKTLWQQYSLKEIRANWPDFFKTKVKQILPGSSIVSELQGELKNEVKRLLAIKHEAITANSMQSSTSELNQVLLPVQAIGDNIVIVSQFLYDWMDVLPQHFCYRVNTNGVNSNIEDDSIQYYLGFPVVISLLYDMAKLLLQSRWILGDIKPGNFKMTLAGEWKLIDYGGHFLNELQDNSSENLIGSNDYSCYSLFHLLNMPPNIEYDPSLVTMSKSLNSRWFSLVKVAIRMMSGKIADYLRGTDLNRTLLQDFQGYHESIFQRLTDCLLNKIESPCHYKHFSLVLKDTDDFFSGNNPGLESTLRRLLFLLGMSLTGYCPWSLLDEEMQQKIVIQYNHNPAQDSTWEVIQESKKITIIEYCQSSCRADRKGLHPSQAIYLMEFLFPGIAKMSEKFQSQQQTRKKVLDKLQKIGLVDLASYFDPPQLKIFPQHVQECLKMIQQADWLNAGLVQKLWEKNFPRIELQSIHQEVSKYISTQSFQSIGWESICQTLDKLQSWQEECFLRYIGVHDTVRMEIEKYVQSYLLDRFSRTQHAWKNNHQELLDVAVKNNWLEKKSNEEITWLENVYQWSNSSSHSHVLIYAELNEENLQNKESALWQVFTQETIAKIQQSSFFPLPPSENLSLDSIVQSLLDFLHYGPSFLSNPTQNLVVHIPHFLNSREILSKKEQEELLHLCQLSRFSSKFIWATIFIAERLLEVISKRIPKIFQQWQSNLKKLGYAQWIQIPKNHEDCQNIIPTIIQKLLEQKNIAQQFSPQELLELLQSQNDIVRAISHLSVIFKNIYTTYTNMEHHVHRHFLMAGLNTDQLPLEYLYQKLKKLTRFIHNDIELEHFLHKLQWDLDFLEQETGRWYCLYNKTFSILQELEKLCQRWSEYANAQGWTITTIRQRRHSTAGIEVDQRALFSEYRPEFSQSFIFDQLHARIIRYIVRGNQAVYHIGKEEYQEISYLLSLVYEYGLLLKPELFSNRTILARIYQFLKQQTNQFRDIPLELNDLKKISLARWQNITVFDLRSKFLQLLPEEVQEPSFIRSVLVEFLQYQAELSRNPQQPPIRKKILAMQLQREHQELQKKYLYAQQQYPEQLLAVNNLFLVRKDDETQNLLKEAQEIWSYKIQLFHDYLKTSQRILDIDKQSVSWNWREFFKDTSNKFLFALYPELKNDEIRDLFLTIFDLNPLPDPKEIKDFMQKCYHFHLQIEQRNQIREILSNSNESRQESFAKAKEYLDIYCIPWAEEEVRRTIEQIPIPSTTKEQFWQKYFAVRKQMAVSRRIKRENRFLNKIHQTEPKEIPNLLLFELWVNKFQSVMETSIVGYFVEEFEQFTPNIQQRIFSYLSNVSQTANPESLFHWLFHHYLLEPTLQMLDNNSMFSTKPSEQILSQLVLKYQLQDIPARVQAQIVKSIKEKISLGWPKSQIASYIIGMIG